MVKLKTNILKLFSENPNKTFKTSELVQKIYGDEYKKLKEAAKTEFDQEKVKTAKRDIATLHRRVLHHLNVLEKEKIIYHTKIIGKGEKCFVYNSLSSEISPDKYDRIMGMFYQPNKEDYLQELNELIEKGYVRISNKNHWLKKTNAILILFKNNIKETLKEIELSSHSTDDVLGVYDFQRVLSYEAYEIELFLSKLKFISSEQGIRINLFLDMHEIKKDNLSKLVKLSVKIPNEIKIVLMFDDLQQLVLDTKFAKILEKFTQNIIIKNKKQYEPPILSGKNNYYYLNIKEWNYVKKNKVNQNKIIYSYNSIIVFMDKILAETNYSEFRRIIVKLAKSLISVTSYQRRHSDIIFSNFKTNSEEDYGEIFKFSKNYIVLKNSLNLLNKNSEEAINLIESSYDKLSDFCDTIENIFKSCGLPTNIKMNFSFQDEINISNIYDKEEISKLGLLDFMQDQFRNIYPIKISYNNKKELSKIINLVDKQELVLLKLQRKKIKELNLMEYFEDVN